MINTQIDYLNIIEVHGLDIADIIEQHIEDVIYNINYLNSLYFEDVVDIFERYPQIFICEQKSFKEKINSFINSIGVDYIEQLENNMNLWEELLW